MRTWCFDCQTMTHCDQHGPLDEIAWDEYESRPDCMGRTLETDAFAEGAEWGAGWLAAIIGMATAIRSRYPSCCDGCGAWVDESKGKFCYACLPAPDVQTVRIRL